MKFEDLKLPDNEVLFDLYEAHGHLETYSKELARMVYDQMHAHYEAKLAEAKPEWRLPDPPPGQQWHRMDWTQDMLVDAEGRQYRPLLLGEKPEDGDEVLFDEWTVQSKYQRRHPVKSGEFHQRTRRPLPAPVEYVPLGPGDIQPGSVVRCICTTWWKQVTGVRAENVTVCAAGNLSWQTLADSWEILRPGSTTWEPCKKIKP